MNGELLAIDDALAVILEQASARRLGVEAIPAAGADGRYLGVPLQAAIDLPPFTNSAMDGFALRSADTPGTLTIVGESAAGAPFDGTLASGQAVAISTGAVLPAGADAVVPVERTSADPAGDTVQVPGPVAVDANVRHRGSDAPAGHTLLPAGRRLGPAQIAAAIAAGHDHLEVGRRPRVALLTTGDELVAPGTLLSPGQIHDSNGPMLAAALRRAGAEVIRIPAAADTVGAHRAAFSEALGHDVVISTGGVSVGEHDLVRRVGAELGVAELFWRIKMRPGKPLSFGVRDRTLVFGIPGNPVSVLVCTELFVAPALAALQGATAPAPRFRRARLAQPVAQNPERDDLIRVTDDGHGQLTPVRGQGSHQISLAALADGLARIPSGTGELTAGTEVAYLPLSDL